jgi:hypothetical protein
MRRVHAASAIDAKVDDDVTLDVRGMHRLRIGGQHRAAGPSDRI